jgi:hypothetical protein
VLLKPVLAAAAALLFVGCVSVGPTGTGAPTSVASGAPSLGVTTPAPISTATLTVAPTPITTPVPIATATTGPIATPDVEPTPTALASEPIPTPAPTASGDVTDRDLLFEDDLTDPASGWSELDQDFATIKYDLGNLDFGFNDTGAWAFTLRALGTSVTSLQPVASFTPQSEGTFGLICGNSLLSPSYGAAVGTDGALTFFSLPNRTTVTVLDRHELDLPVTVGSPVAFALRCLTNASGSIVLEAALAKTGVIAMYQADNVSPGAFDVVGLYGAALSDGYTFTVDQTAVYGLAVGADGTMSPGAEALKTHIPEDFQKNCFETPLFSDEATDIVTCALQLKGAGAEVVQYEQYDSADLMNADYQDLVDSFGVESQGSCQSGPNESSWEVGTTVGGRVQCAPQTVGIRFDWTDDTLLILSSLADFGGKYSEAYDDWVNAGPNGTI